MGKKRTNAAKKKQAAKKKKLSSAYGVSVLKGGTIARNNGVLSSNSVADGSIKNNANAKKQKGPSSNNNEQGSMTIHPDGNVNAQEMRSNQQRGSHGENDEFERQHASLEERSLALQARNNEQRRRKKGRKAQQKKGWGKFARPSTTNFAPATLTLAPKSTQELVDDAANQVAQGMNEIGHRAATTLDGLSVAPGKSSLAAAASLNWKLRVSNVSNQEEQQQNQNNPYGALDIDSDSDNEWAEKKSKAVQPFQFKPASFSFQPVASTTSTFASGADEIDPDL